MKSAERRSFREEQSSGAWRCRTLLLLALAILLGITSPSAYIQEDLVEHGLGDFGLFVAGGALVEHLEKDASFRITDGSDITALTDSMKRWTDVPTSSVTVTRGTDFDFTNPIDASTGISNDGVNRMYFAQADAQNQLDVAVAVSFLWVASTGQIVDCDTVFNERLYTFSTTTPANPNQILGTKTYDVGEIATHEMGHCLGLDHSPIAGRFSSTTGLEVSGFTSGDFTYQSTMGPFGTRTIQGRTLSQDDIAGISLIYPDPSLATTTATIKGRVLDGGTFAPIRGAHVVAVSTAAPDVPVAGAVSDVSPGGLGGDYAIPALPPGTYAIRIEPLVNTTNPFTAANTYFTSFNTSFPWEFFNGAGESGFDVATDLTALSLTAGQTSTGIDVLTNVGAPDPNEPNGTPASATITTCEHPVSASIVPLGDIDYYSLAIVSPTHIDAEVNASRSGSPLDAIAGIFDAAGNRLGFADNTVGLDPIAGADLFAVGTYYIAVASYNDSGFTGSGAQTVGSYALTVHCSIPKVPAGTCPGKVLYAGSGGSGTLQAIADVDGDLHADGITTFAGVAGTTQGYLATRRDGGVCLGTQGSDIDAFWDDTGDFSSDRSASIATTLNGPGTIALYRRSGVEELFAAGVFGDGTVLEMDDGNGDFVPDRTTIFTTDPLYVQSLAVDEAGTVYVLDVLRNSGAGAILAYRDTDGDGVADVATTFLDGAPYNAIGALRPGEVYATDYASQTIVRFADVDGDGVADRVTTYATGVAMDALDGPAFDTSDVPYIADGGNRVLALPDDNGDGVADRQVQFSPILPGGVGALAFGQSPPEEVSRPGSYTPATVSPAGGGLRLTWEDQGPTVPSYNIYQGTLGTFYSHVPLVCHVSGTQDGHGSRFLDITPGDASSHYYLVTASDRCGEGSAGRSSDGRRIPPAAVACGPAP